MPEIMPPRLCLMILCLCLALPGRAALAETKLTIEHLCSALGAELEGRPTANDLTFVFRPDRSSWRVATADKNDAAGRPDLQVRITPPCTPRLARRLKRDEAGMVSAIEILGPDLETVIDVEPQNPPFPPATPTETPLLALVDTGVNYLLPAFNESLAVKSDGRLFGYDFWDNDDRPFDSDPRRNLFFPLHHGSTVFSVLAAEAPGLPVAIYRFPAPEMCRFGAMIDTIADAGIRVVNMSMGSRDRNDWACFADAAGRHEHILFVVSAGNDGENIDSNPVYPAALALTNMIVVTSGDEFGRLDPASNYGQLNVDLMVPAEAVPVIDHRGVRSDAGGSSYAAPRVAALATRFLNARPEASTQDIIDYLVWRTINNSDLQTRHGWIPDPTDDYGFTKWRN